MRASARFGIGHRWYLAIAAVVAFLATMSLLAGCAQLGISDELAPPEAAVDSLLQLRVERSADASAYAEYVSEPMAATLAAADAADTAGALIPEWKTPFMSVDGTTTADVVVVWVDPESFDQDWPAATVFKMELVGDKWLAMDAESIIDKGFVPEPK